MQSVGVVVVVMVAVVVVGVVSVVMLNREGAKEGQGLRGGFDRSRRRRCR